MSGWRNRLSWVALLTAVTLGLTTLPAGAVGGLDVENRTLGFGTVGVPYSEDVSATGTGTTPYAWTVTAGALPAGLALSNASNKGRIAGTPTTAGSYTFTLQVADSATATATRAFTIPVYPVLQVTTSSLPNGEIGASYAQALAAAGGSGSYSSWSLTNGTLPPGLTLNAGVISGTPTTVGSWDFTVRVTDSVGITMDRGLSITVGVSGQLAVATPSIGQVTVNIPYNLQLTATGGSRIYSRWALASGALPTGLSLNATTGLISGTPTATGTFTATVQVADSDTTTATRTLAFTVGSSPCAHDGSLGPITSAQTSAMPAAGLAPGVALVLDCGNPHSHSVTAVPTTSPTAIEVRSFATTLRVEGRTSSGAPAGTRDGTVALLRATSGSTVALEGSGARPNSTAQAWLLPGTSLGSLTADATGTFRKSVELPAGTSPGTLTVQVNMAGPDGQVRSVSLGVVVVEEPRSITRERQRTSVRFRSGSARLTPRATDRLDALIGDVGDGSVLSVTVRGFARDPVRPGSTKATRRKQNLALAKRRAAAVATYLREQGITVIIDQQARGPVKAYPGAKGRRANVTMVVSRIT